MFLDPIQKSKQLVKQQLGIPIRSIGEASLLSIFSYRFLMCDGWPWPAVTGVADCLPCPIRNQEDWSVAGLPGQRTVGEYTQLVLTGLMTSTDPETKSKKDKHINLTLHTEEASPSFYRKDLS